MDNKFNFFIPFNEEAIEKAAKEPLANRYKNMVLEGMASDNSKDIEGEILEPSGYVVDHFLKSGYVNYEHLSKKSPKFIIGTPTSAKVKGNEFHITAKLWENSEVARDAWDKIIEMKESGSDRKAGWSIEGKSLERDAMNPKRITKALITNVALTFSPVNTNSWATISKGLQKEDYIEPEYDKDTDDKDFILEFEKNGKKYRVGKDFKVFEVIAKAMDTAAVKPMTPESLEGKTKNIAVGEIKKALDNILRHSHLLQNNPELKIKIVKLLKNS
jgi:hypothetical protein